MMRHTLFEGGRLQPVLNALDIPLTIERGSEAALVAAARAHR